MDILLDTHAAIWFCEGDTRLSESAVDAICNLENTIFVSVASLWEIAIKVSKGKLSLEGGIDGFLDAVYMLVAQAMTQNMEIVTEDSEIPKYGVKTIW